MILRLGVGPGKRKANDYVLELMNNFLNSAKGNNFTKETMITAADALSFLHTIRKSVEDDLTGIHHKRVQMESLLMLTRTIRKKAYAGTEDT